ncbi:hypothetical protein MSAN_01529400 [Mycena sanguinolenta]|uniref:F-box domain-containing protein n=1 Tax=Mycena sanguinolenta TaxID=230812 RepID=A0A8H6Y7S1_9AGAR|nr:hypothetical protein MSAN_01529400 [Mycena sanguinolenta]
MTMSYIPQVDTDAMMASANAGMAQIRAGLDEKRAWTKEAKLCCDYCKKHETSVSPLQACSRCRSVRYCSPMPFEALGEDVLFRISCFCDVSTPLAVSAINKPLRRIAFSKQLWLSLVLDTSSRDALELPPPNRERLECLSTEELVAVVKNAVTGPGSEWDDESPASVIKTKFQISFDNMQDCPEIRLLPGARYILRHSRSTTQQRLCIYDVWSARSVWECPVETYTECEVDLVPVVP